MNRLFPRSLTALSLLGSVALSRPAAAQDVAAAETLFNHGVAEMEARNFKVACAEIAESHRLDPRPGTLYTLAQCEVRWDHVATAMTHLGDYLALYERLTPDQKTRQRERPKVAQAQRDKLSLEVPELTLVLPPEAPAGTVVKRDDTVVAPAALGLGLPLDPGEHVVSTLAPGGEIWKQQFTIVKGERKRLVLEAKAAPRIEAAAAASTPAKAPAVAEAVKGPSTRRVAAYVIGSVGVAGLVAGGVMGGLALGKKAIIAENCGPGVDPKNPGDATRCREPGLAAAAAVKPLGLGSTIGFAAGLAGVGTAIVLILTEPRKATPATGARGPWVSASVLSAGPESAMVGAHGSW